MSWKCDCCGVTLPSEIEPAAQADYHGLTLSLCIVCNAFGEPAYKQATANAYTRIRMPWRLVPVLAALALAFSPALALAHPGHGMPEAHNHGDLIAVLAAFAAFAIAGWLDRRPTPTNKRTNKR